jgi:hypothetical protein
MAGPYGQQMSGKMIDKIVLWIKSSYYAQKAGFYQRMPAFSLSFRPNTCAVSIIHAIYFSS